MEKFYIWLEHFRSKHTWINQNYILDQDLYHYTSIEALDSILKNNSLWLTKINYMNDYEEMLYAIDLIKECLEEIDSAYVKDYMLKLCNSTVIDEIYKEVYILSLSYDRDSVPLWNNYGTAGGYNLKFSRDFWKDVKDDFFRGEIYIGTNYEVDQMQYSYLFRPVIYNSEEQKNRIMTLLNGMKELVNKGINIESKKNIQLLAYYIIDEICFYKRDGHQAEREFRLMVRFINQDMNKFIKHRIFNGSFIPYIEIKFKKNYFDVITIGPRHNLDFVEKGLNSYLKYMNKKIEINRSKLRIRY